MNHLTDETLNEYLDAALPPDTRALAAAHLAGCPACATRLAVLEEVVFRFDALRVPALSADLSANVLAALPQPPVAATRPAPRPALNWVFAAQALAALILLAMTWPFVSTFVATWANPNTAIGLDLHNAVGQIETWLTLAANPARAVQHAWTTVQAWWADMVSVATHSGPALGIGPLGSVETALLVAAAAGLWLVGNVLLLRRPISTLLRRR